MKKIIILSICIFLNVAAYGQTYWLNSKRIYSSVAINGYVRDAAFYNDICYLVSGNGSKVLMTKSDGTEVTTNYFSSITFNEAMKIYVDDNYVFVLDLNSLKFYTKQGELKYSIPITSSDACYEYFWVKSKQEIMLVSNNRILVYDYSTRALLKSFTPSYEFTSNTNNGDRFINDGNKLYDWGVKLVTYEYRGGEIYTTDITTSKYRSLKSEQNYFAGIINNESLWFNYFDRSKAFFVNSNFSSVVRNCNNFLSVSKNPTDEDLYTESGNPNLKIFYSQGKVYAINILQNKVEFYMLESKPGTLEKDIDISKEEIPKGTIEIPQETLPKTLK